MAEAGPPGALEQRRVVTRDGDTLRLQRAGGAKNPLRPLGDDRFETVEGAIPVRFLRDPGGKVVAVEVDNGGGPLLPPRRTDEPIPAERLHQGGRDLPAPRVP